MCQKLRNKKELPAYYPLLSDVFVMARPLINPFSCGTGIFLELSII